MRRILAGTAVSILIIFIFLPVSFGFVSARQSEFDSNSDLVIDAERSPIVMSGTEYALKGNLEIREDGVLEIRDTHFEIYQEHPNQFSIELENSAGLILKNSTLISEKALDLNLNTGSTLELQGSTLDLSGDISGEAEDFRSEDSEIRVEKIGLDAAGDVTFEDSEVESETMLISSPAVDLNRSVFHTELIFYGETEAESYGSLFENIETDPEAKASIYGRVSLSVRDEMDVPIGEAEVIVNRPDFEDRNQRFETGRNGEEFDYFPGESERTDKSGEWQGYLIVEDIETDRSVFKGNYNINVSMENEVSKEKTISLAPADRRTPDREREELVKNLDFTLPDVLPPTSYYDRSEDDLQIDGDREHSIETYPNEGMDNYVHQGNILLNDWGSLNIGERSSVKILQKGENYRIELRDNSELSIQDQGSIRSEKPLNVYLYDKSSLSVDGAELDIGSLYMDDSSSLKAENSRIYTEEVRFHGESFDLTDSVVYSREIKVDGNEIILRRSEISTDRDVFLKADNFEVEDLDVETSILFGSEERTRVSITNVTAEEIVPIGDTTIERRWHLHVEIFNGEDRLVPSVDLDIYQQEGLEKEFVKTVFVEDGRAEVPLKSEVINSNGSRFDGNYILEADKTVEDEVVTSETTRVAVDSNVRAELRFKEEFPYSIVIEVELPERVDPGETFEIKGRAVYEGVDLEVSNATVEVILDDNEDLRWNTTTDEKGRFELEVRAPQAIRTSSLHLRVHDKEMMMESEISQPLDIKRDEELSIREFLFATTMGRFISITGIIVLLVLAYKILTTPMEKAEASISTSNNMVNWTEKSLKKE